MASFSKPGILKQWPDKQMSETPSYLRNIVKIYLRISRKGRSPRVYARVSSGRFKAMHVLVIPGAWEMQLDGKWKYWSVLYWRGSSFLAPWEKVHLHEWWSHPAPRYLHLCLGPSLLHNLDKLWQPHAPNKGVGCGSISAVHHTHKLEWILLA